MNFYKIFTYLILPATAGIFLTTTRIDLSQKKILLIMIKYPSMIEKMIFIGWL